MKLTSGSYKRLIAFLNAAFSVTFFTAIFAFVWENFYNEGITGMVFFKNGNILLYCIYAVILFLFMEIYGAFGLGKLRITDFAFTNILALVFTSIVAYFQTSLMSRMLLDPIPLLISLGICFIFIIFWSIFINKNFAKLFPPKRMIIVYGSHSAVSLVEKMSKIAERYIISSSISVTEDLEKIKTEILKYDAVIICDTPNEIRNDVLKFCYHEKILTYITPKISDILIRGAESIHTLDTPLLVCRNFGIPLEQRIFKRCADIFISFIAMIIASPFMAIIAVAIKSYDKGKVLYKQERLTIDGKKFYLYKFRSMLENAESDGVARLAAEGDSRITPVGKVLRKLRLDELPQIFNILHGEMSIVGPRPERPEIAAEYEKDMPEFRYRLNVKAGLTGYAQVMGKYNTTAYDKLKLDLMYIQNFSLVLDLKLMFLTLKTIFIPESTEGIDENSVNAMDESYKQKEKLKL